jgi:hypothetical protein
MLMPWNRRIIETAGGCFTVHDSGGGRSTILYLHDELSSAPHQVADQLAVEHRVIAPVHPGFGSAERPEWVESVRDSRYRRTPPWSAPLSVGG